MTTNGLTRDKIMGHVEGYAGGQATMPRITLLEDLHRGRFILEVPGANNNPIRVEFYPFQRPERWQPIEPDVTTSWWLQYCGFSKHTGPTGAQHYLASLLEVRTNDDSVVGPQLLSGHEFVVDPSHRAVSQFHGHVVFVDNADDALRRAMDEAKIIRDGLLNDKVYQALEGLFKF